MTDHRRITRSDVFRAFAAKWHGNLEGDVLAEIAIDMQFEGDALRASVSEQVAILSDYAKYTFRGAPNAYLEAEFLDAFGARVMVIGEEDDLLVCPCCGAKSLTERYAVDAGTGYDICGCCAWEDDGTMVRDAWSSVNRGTMAEYATKAETHRNRESGRWRFSVSTGREEGSPGTDRPE